MQGSKYGDRPIVGPPAYEPLGESPPPRWDNVPEPVPSPAEAVAATSSVNAPPSLAEMRDQIADLQRQIDELRTLLEHK